MYAYIIWKIYAYITYACAYVNIWALYTCVYVSKNQNIVIGAKKYQAWNL